MKKLLFFLFAISALCLYNVPILCAQDNMSFPCMEEAMDDEQYLRTMAIGQDSTMQGAILIAQYHAQQALYARIHGFYGEGIAIEGLAEIICQYVKKTLQNTYIVHVALQASIAEIEKRASQPQ